MNLKYNQNVAAFIAPLSLFSSTVTLLLRFAAAVVRKSRQRSGFDATGETWGVLIKNLAG